MEKKQNIAIVGGGVIGCLSAWQLARAGHTVALYEAKQVGGKDMQASAAAFGALVPYGAHRVDWLPSIHRESITAWEGLAEELGDCGYVNKGGLRIMEDGTRVPEPTMAYLSPSRTMAALKQACLNGGVALHENTPSPALVHLSKNHDAVVVACGLGVNDYLGLSPKKHLVRPVWGDVLRVFHPTFRLPHMVRAGKIFLIPHDGNSFLIGGTKWETGEEEPKAKRHRFLLEKAVEVLGLPPSELQLQEAWQGARPMLNRKRTTLLDVHDTYSNVLICAGYGGIGWCLAPKVAEGVLTQVAQMA